MTSTEQDRVKLEGPRAATLEDRTAVLEMINYIFRVSRERAPTIAHDWAHVYAAENLSNVMVVCDRSFAQNRPVASTGVWVSEVAVSDSPLPESSLRVGGINCVGTLSEYRRHGLGSKVMAAAEQRMRELGCHIGLLSTGIPNWYRRMHWEEAGSRRAYRLNRGNIHLLPAPRAGLQARVIDLNPTVNTDVAAPLSLAKIDPEVAAHVVRLHALDRMGAWRDVTRFCQLAVARQVERIVFLEDATAPVAYLLLHGTVVTEWGGAPEEVAALLRAYFDTLDQPQASTSQRGDHNPTLTMQTPAWAHPVVALLDQARIPHNSHYLGMILLLEPQAILDAYGIHSVQVERVNHDYHVVAGSARVTMDARQLTKLFFGPERVSPIAPEHFPLRFWQWVLEMV